MNGLMLRAAKPLLKLPALLVIVACAADTGVNGSYCLSAHLQGVAGQCSDTTSILVGAGQNAELVVEAQGKFTSATIPVAIDLGSFTGVTVTPSTATLPVPGQVTFTLSVPAGADFQQPTIVIRTTPGDNAEEEQVVIGLNELKIGNACANVLAFGPIGTFTSNAGRVNPDSTRWSTSNASVITVSPRTGSSVTVSATGNGKASLTAALGTATASMQCSVTQTPQSVSVSPQITSLGIGQSVQLTATVRDFNKNVMSWPVTYSADGSAATVSSTGVVTGVQTGLGQIRISATSAVTILLQFSVQ